MVKHEYKNTTSSPDPNSTQDDKQYTDLICYPDSIVDEVKKTDYSRFAQSMEVKPIGTRHDPSDNTINDIESDAKTRREVRGQIINYTAASTTTPRLSLAQPDEHRDILAGDDPCALPARRHSPDPAS